MPEPGDVRYENGVPQYFDGTRKIWVAKEPTGGKGTPAAPRVKETATSGATTRGKDLGAKGASTTGMPKQEDGETPSAYSERLRKWREEQKANPAVDGQKKAIKNMRETKETK